MRRRCALALLALAALALPATGWSAEPPPDPTPLWSQYPLDPATSAPAETVPPPDSAVAPPPTPAPADTGQALPESGETLPAPTGTSAPTTTAPALSPAATVPDVPASNAPPVPAVTHQRRDLTWLLVGLAVLLMLASVTWAILRNARTAPARRPTPLSPRQGAEIERCSVVVERTRGHARFAAVVEEEDGSERIVARSPAFRAIAGKEPRPDGRPLAAYESLMTALADERWRRTGTIRTVRGDDGPQHGTPEWYEEQLERIAAARERARTRRRAAP